MWFIAQKMQRDQCVCSKNIQLINKNKKNVNFLQKCVDERIKRVKMHITCLQAK